MLCYTYKLSDERSCECKSKLNMKNRSCTSVKTLQKLVILTLFCMGIF